jgi:predicted ATPase
MFWLTTASVVRGELPQAHEAITTLLRLVKARGDQPALLNALRGQGMIFLFMGNIVEAQTAIERAIDAFNASEEGERLAARSAGQDAGVANLALMSWALWVRGGVDEAVMRIDAALQRADLLQHPHTQAYAYYYASVLHGLRGEPTIAYDRAKRCVALSEEHGFRQWLGLSRAVQGICAAVTNGSSNRFEEVMAAVDEYRRRGYQLGVTALYVLLCPALLHSHQPAAALEVIDQGLLIARQNAERVFEADLNRLKARALLLHDAPTAGTVQDAQSLLSQALTIAQRQGARSLELRAARDLARLWIDQGRGDEARRLITPIYAAFTEGFETQDLIEAKALLDRPQ